MLRACSNDASVQAEDLFSLIYADLRKTAHTLLRRERKGHTLQTTALINETYIKLHQQRKVKWDSRDHFFAICAKLMRRILIDYAKTRNRSKRGAGLEHLQIDGLTIGVEQAGNVDLLALDCALNRLAKLDPQQERIVELRYFSGLSIEETAGVLGISDSTVKREWRSAKAWLRRELGEQSRG